MSVTFISKEIGKTSLFALEEIKKYFGYLKENYDGRITLEVNDGYFADKDKTKDSVYFNVENGVGVIAGNTERALLLAVYKFLKALGFDFVRPGVEGDVIPDSIDLNRKIYKNKTAVSRFRGMASDDVCDYRAYLELIDWLPKIGMNCFMKEGIAPERNLVETLASGGKPLDEESGKKALKEVYAEAKKRGLERHAVGHGWHFAPTGMSVEDAYKYTEDSDIPDSVRQKLAVIHGRRQFHLKTLIMSNLCYSDPDTYNCIVNQVIEYAEAHPDIDYLHFWLGDGYQNNCECEKCSKVMPSDIYVRMLNDIDEGLTAKGLENKIVFLIYCDLLWPPKFERIKNPKRFTMMFAPITRKFDETYLDSDNGLDTAPYIRNEQRLPRPAMENILYYREWRKIFKGECFDFDYHLMWNRYMDVTQIFTSKIIYRDMLGLQKEGIDGNISCGLWNSAMPVSLPHIVMGEALFEGEFDLESFIKTYFEHTFGKDFEKVLSFCENISNAIPPLYRWEGEQQYENIPKTIAAETEKIKSVLNEKHDEKYALSYLLLSFTRDILELYGKCINAKINHDETDYNENLNALKARCDEISKTHGKYMTVESAKYMFDYICKLIK